MLSVGFSWSESVERPQPTQVAVATLPAQHLRSLFPYSFLARPIVCGICFTLPAPKISSRELRPAWHWTFVLGRTMKTSVLGRGFLRACPNKQHGNRCPVPHFVDGASEKQVSKQTVA